MSDWYERAQEMLEADACKHANVSVDQFTAIYSFLNEIGLIDYDIEKEVLYERYIEE